MVGLDNFSKMMRDAQDRVDLLHLKLKSEEGPKLVAYSLENNALFQHLKLKSKSTNQ